MSIDDSILLLQKYGLRVDKIDKNQFRVWYLGGELIENYMRGGSGGDWSGRQIVRLAKFWDNRGSAKANVKEFDKSKNRAATRDAIKKEDFDSIPLNGKTKQADIWGWD